MGWKIIEIENMCNLKIFMDSLIVSRERKLIIPISDIDTLIISNNRINITVNLINELSSSSVCVIFCDNKYIPKSLLLGFNVKKQSYQVFQKQLQWTKEFKEKCWNNISFRKINNQLKLLKDYKLPTNDWDLFIHEDVQYKNKNYESQVANLFFHSLYGKDFNRDKKTEINYILNYGYVILTSMVSRSIVKKGLHHQISFEHGSAYSQFPLSYDIVEPFRIIVDNFVKQLFELKIIEDVDRVLRKELKQCFLEYISEFKVKLDDNFFYLNTSIDTFIDWILKDEINLHKMNFIFKSESIIMKEQINETGL